MVPYPRPSGLVDTNLVTQASDVGSNRERHPARTPAGRAAVITVSVAVSSLVSFGEGDRGRRPAREHGLAGPSVQARLSALARTP